MREQSIYHQGITMERVNPLWFDLDELSTTLFLCNVIVSG